MIARIAGLLPECSAGRGSLDEDPARERNLAATLVPPVAWSPCPAVESELGAYCDEARPNIRLRAYTA